MHLGRPGAGEEQGDVRAQPPSEHRDRSVGIVDGQGAERRIGVGEQDLGGVPATARHGRGAVAREVERGDRTGPRRHVPGDIGR